jgi:hypothetical protein
MGVRRIRFRPIRGLGALSATEDVPIGIDAVGGVQVAVPKLLPVPSDRMTMLAVSGGVGGASSLLRWSFKGEWVSARRDLFLRDAARNVLQHQLLFGKAEIHNTLPGTE